MFIQRLREATKEAHQQLDVMLIPYIKGASNNGQYAALLKCFYGYFNAVEGQLAQYLNDELVPAFSQRRKSGVIVEELQGLGYNDALPTAAELPQISNIAEALGSMYVLEGSTLGGKIIAKILGSNLQRDPETLRFFNFYGAATEQHWGSFVQALNNYAETLDEAQKESMIEAAKDTFYRFREWIEDTYVNAPPVEA